MKPSTHCRRMIQFSNFLLASMLAFAIPAAAQNPSDQAGDSTSTVKDFIRAADGLLAIQVALGQANGADADSRLEAAVQGFVARGAPAAELVAMRSELQVAAGGFFADLDRGIAGATSFPGPLPTEVSRALARRLLGTARSKFTEALARGRDPLPILAQAAKVLARVRGFTDLPRELDRFADAAERAERLAARMPAPPTGMGPVAAGGPPPRSLVCLKRALPCSQRRIPRRRRRVRAPSPSAVHPPPSPRRTRRARCHLPEPQAPRVKSRHRDSRLRRPRGRWCRPLGPRRRAPARRCQRRPTNRGRRRLRHPSRCGRATPCSPFSASARWRPRRSSRDSAGWTS